MTMPPDDEEQRRRRRQMIETQLRRQGIADAAVLAAMERVPRHWFVPSEALDEAYADKPLPLDIESTISQPYIVGLMTQALALRPGDRVLEIGTGSGYQTAVLALLARTIYSIESQPRLAAEARQRLAGAGFQVVDASEAAETAEPATGRIVLRAGNGWRGWPEAAPFDAILVTAACPGFPAALFEQLHEGGRLVYPHASAEPQLERGEDQRLYRVSKTGGEPKLHFLGHCRFVPLQN